MENLNITGSADISLFGTSRDDLTKSKTFDGGSMTITERAPFSVNASVYEEDEDAYINTEGNRERQWRVRPEDEEIYLGTLTYRNSFFDPIDFGDTAVGSIIDVTLDTPAQGKLRGNGNFFLDIDQEREGPETLELGFRGADPNNLELISTDNETVGVIPYRFDFIGGRVSGSSEEVDPSFTFTVLDNTSVSIDLYGRVFALDTGELPVNDGFDTF